MIILLVIQTLYYELLLVQFILIFFEFLHSPSEMPCGTIDFITFHIIPSEFEQYLVSYNCQMVISYKPIIYHY